MADAHEEVPDVALGRANMMTFGVAPIAAKSGIRMDTSKAMSILGFSSSHTFETTSMEELNSAFLYRMNILMRSEQKQRGYNARKQERRRDEIRHLNEALQYLTRKRGKSERTLEEWKARTQRQVMISKTLEALALDETTAWTRTDEQREKAEQKKIQKELESKRALALAEELAGSLAVEETKILDEKEKLKQ